MAIASGDIKLHYSTGSITPGANSYGLQSTSLGGYVSLQPIIQTLDLHGVVTSVHNIFPDISGVQNSQTPAYTDYSCLFVYNSNTSNTFINPVVYVVLNTPPPGIAAPTEIRLGVDYHAATTFPLAIDGNYPPQCWPQDLQACQVLDSLTAPTPLTVDNTPNGVAFFLATSRGTAIHLYSTPGLGIGPGECRAFWVQRKVNINNTSAVDRDGITLYVEGDTTA